MNQKSKFKQTEIGMIPEEWEEKRLGDCLKLIRKLFSPSKDDVCPYIGLEHIEQQTLRLMGFGSSNDVESNKFEFKAGQILFGKLRPYFRKLIRPKFNGVCSTDIWVIDTKGENDNAFFFYFLAGQRIINEANNSSEGTRMPRARWDYLEQLKLPIPPLAEQRAIAKILSDLDAKIELNQQMNKTLEEIGRAIFKHWFVDFEFPNEEGKPYKSSGGEMVYNEELGKEIPKGWRVGFLGDLIHEKRVKIGDRNAQVLSAIKTGELVHSEDFFMKQVFSKNINKYLEVCMFDFAYNPARINIGSIGMLKENILGAVSPAYVVFSCRSKSHYFIEQMLKLSSIKKQIIQFCSGTVRQILEFEGISKIKLIIPNENLFIKYNEVYEGMLFQKDFLNSEIQTLSQIRDALLPKLMSGKIRVPLEGKE